MVVCPEFILGFALQAPISSFIGWIYILARAPYRVGDRIQVLERCQVLGRDEVPPVELRAGGDVRQHVVLAAGLGAGAAVRAPLGDHPGHEALPGVGDAEGPVDERLEAKLGHRAADGPDVVERVLAGEHDPLDPEPLHDEGTADIVHRHLGGAVDLELRVDALDEPDQADVLDDGCVDAAIDRLAQELEGIGQLGRLYEDVEGEVDPPLPRVGDATGLLHLVQAELGALVAGVVARGAEVDGVGAVCHGGAHGVERAGRRQ